MQCKKNHQKKRWIDTRGGQRDPRWLCVTRKTWGKKKATLCFTRRLALQFSNSWTILLLLQKTLCIKKRVKRETERGPKGPLASLSVYRTNATSTVSNLFYSTERQKRFASFTRRIVGRPTNNVIAIKKIKEITYRRVANGWSDASGGAWAYMAIRRIPVIRTRKRRILLIHPLGMLPTILTSLQINKMGKLCGRARRIG